MHKKIRLLKLGFIRFLKSIEINPEMDCGDIDNIADSIINKRKQLQEELNKNA